MSFPIDTYFDPTFVHNQEEHVDSPMSYSRIHQGNAFILQNIQPSNEKTQCNPR